MRIAAPLLFLIASLSIPAKADLTYIGSQAGLCCFDVTLHQLTDAVQVTATLTDGAEFFVDTGAGNHPGFAFNVDSGAITVSNVSAPWLLAMFHFTAVTTGGPAMGTFSYYFDNPGNGSSAHNPGPLQFTVNRSGITPADFVANASGFFFAADILDAAGATGMSGISDPARVPEPGSVLFLCLAALGGVAVLRKGASSRA